MPLEVVGDVPLALYQGRHFTESYEWLVDDVVQSLAGYRVTSQIRRHANSTSALLLDLDEFLSIDGNMIVLDLPSSAVRTIPSSGFWDMFLIEIADEDQAFPLLAGRVTLTKAVTLDD